MISLITPPLYSGLQRFVKYPTYLSRWDITVLEMSAPASCSIRMIWNGAPGFLPGWMMTGQPSRAWAWAVACSTFLSLSVKGQEQPISPITPHLMLVPSAPWRISLTRTSVSWGRLRMSLFYRLWNTSKQTHTVQRYLFKNVFFQNCILSQGAETIAQSVKSVSHNHEGLCSTPTHIWMLGEAVHSWDPSTGETEMDGSQRLTGQSV